MLLLLGTALSGGGRGREGLRCSAELRAELHSHSPTMHGISNLSVLCDEEENVIPSQKEFCVDGAAPCTLWAASTQAVVQ